MVNHVNVTSPTFPSLLARGGTLHANKSMTKFLSNPSQHPSPLIYNISVTWFPTGGYLETTMATISSKCLENTSYQLNMGKNHERIKVSTDLWRFAPTLSVFTRHFFSFRRKHDDVCVQTDGSIPFALHPNDPHRRQHRWTNSQATNAETRFPTKEWKIVGSDGFIACLWVLTQTKGSLGRVRQNVGNHPLWLHECNLFIRAYMLGNTDGTITWGSHEPHRKHDDVCVENEWFHPICLTYQWSSTKATPMDQKPSYEWRDKISTKEWKNVDPWDS